MISIVISDFPFGSELRDLGERDLGEIECVSGQGQRALRAALTTGSVMGACI